MPIKRATRLGELWDLKGDGNAQHFLDGEGNWITPKLEYDTAPKLGGDIDINNKVISAIKKIVFSSFSTVTISSAAITVTNTCHCVATEGGAASDSLDTINGGSTGQILFLIPNVGQEIILSHNTGNVVLQGGRDMRLKGFSGVFLMFVGLWWVDVSRGIGLFEADWGAIWDFTNFTTFTTGSATVVALPRQLYLNVGNGNGDTAGGYISWRPSPTSFDRSIRLDVVYHHLVSGANNQNWFKFGADYSAADLAGKGIAFTVKGDRLYLVTYDTSLHETDTGYDLAFNTSYLITIRHVPNDKCYIDVNFVNKADTGDIPSGTQSCNLAFTAKTGAASGLNAPVVAKIDYDLEWWF